MKISTGFMVALLVVSIALSLGSAHAACTVTTTPVAFGSYHPMSANNLDSTGTIRVTTDENLKITVAIGPTSNGGGFNPRRLKRTTGSDLLTYNLYTSATCTAIWGDGTQSTSLMYKRLNRSSYTWTVYGRVPGSQNVPVGQYADTLVVTVNY